MWFYLGALAATFAIGIAAAIVLGSAPSSHHASTPKTWVAILDLIGALFLVVSSPDPGLFHSFRSWLENHANQFAAAVVLLLYLSLLRGGIAGLTGVGGRPVGIRFT